MAARFWVGGSGNWDAATTTHWAASSGGAGGQSVPGAGDSVTIDDSSGGGTITQTATGNCSDFACTIASPANKVILAQVAQNLNCAGSWTMPDSTKFGFTATTGGVTFTSTASGKTITSGTNSFPGNVTFNGVGGVWAQADAFVAVLDFTHSAGTYQTANFALTARRYVSGTASTRVLTLGSSAVSITGLALGGEWNISNVTGYTLTGGTYVITFTNRITGFVGGGLTYNDVVFQQPSNNATLGATIAMTGLNTFRNMTFVKVDINNGFFTITNDITITGTLTGLSGTATPNQRMIFNSSAFGTPRTITAAAVVLANCDFRFITGAGAATWSGTSLGDHGGNTNITFTAPKTVYWNLTGAAFFQATAWATTPGGVPNDANFPLPQDTAVWTDLGAATALTIDTAYGMPGIDMSARTIGFSLAYGAIALNFMRSIILFPGLTLTGTQQWSMRRQGNWVLNMAGVTHPSNMGFDVGTTAAGSVPGSVTLLADVTMAALFFMMSGEIIFNGHTLTTTRIVGSTVFTKIITIGSGSLVVTGPTIVQTVDSTLTFTPGTGSIICNSAGGKNFSGAGLSYPVIVQGGAGTLNIIGASTFKDIQANAAGAGSTVTLPASTVTTVTNFNLGGLTGSRITLNSSIAGTPATISKASGLVRVSHLNIKDSTVTGGATFQAPVTPNDNTNVSGNTGWDFGALTAAQGPLLLVGAGQ